VKGYNAYPCHDPFHLSWLLGYHGSKKKEKKCYYTMSQLKKANLTTCQDQKKKMPTI